jgi:putative membrane protein
MTPEARRLHPAAIGAEALAQLRGLALPIVVVALVGGGGGDVAVRTVVFAAIGAVVSIVVAYLQWSRTAWRVERDTVLLRRGVFTVSETSVPFDRVQAVDTVRGPVQRLFGVVELHVQAAGGGRQGEVVLRAVTQADADALREAIRAGGAEPAEGVETVEGAEAPVPAVAPTWHLAPRTLLVAALTSGSLGVLVPIVAGASQVLDDVLGTRDAQRLLPDTAGEAALLAAAVLALAWVLSMLGTVVAFAGFRVTRDGERLRIARGIVERREQSVPVARVSAVRVVESPLRQPFGLATVRLETAGYAREAAAAQTLLPLVRRGDVPALLERLLPELAGPVDGLEPPPPRARRRAVVPPVAAALAVAAVAVALAGAPGLAALALVPAAGAYGLAVFAAAGWRLDAGRLVVRGRRLARTTAIADARRLPELGLRTTPFQRRAGLARVAVAVSSGRRAHVDDLDRPVAEGLVARLGALARG